MGIRYDGYVKRPLEEFDYEPWHIKELETCIGNINHFLKYIQIVNPDRGVIPFKPYPYQKTLLKKFKKHRFNVGLLSRQSGKTTAVSIYALWYSIFHSNKVIGIVSNKESSAKMILARFKDMYEKLPFWLKPGVKEYQKKGISFDNGTQIIISATSPNAFRGQSINLLICDEFAFVPKNEAIDFWSANYPTVSASTESKIIIISTPNGMYNIFHRIYSQAERGENSFVPTKVAWNKVPGRDKEWKKQELKNLGRQKFKQEYAVEFLGSTNTVIDSDILEQIIGLWKEPIHYDLNNKFSIYEKPVDGAIYVLGVDTAKGTGEHYSAIQVIKLLNMKPVKMEQVASYVHNLIDVYTFADLVDRISRYYNHAYIMCENNSEGAAVVNKLWWDLENEGLVNTGSKTIDLGVRAKRNTKPTAVLLMKKLIEDGALKLIDKETLDQLTTFIESNNKFYGKDMPDDLISALYWACYILEMNIWDETYEFTKSKESDDDIWGILADVEESVEDWSWLTDSGSLME
jgi:hypothetical protein